MKILRYGVFAAVVAMAGLGFAQSAKKPATMQHADRERLIGAWHLAHIDRPAADGKQTDMAQPKGVLIYTRDGHMSVQLMYTKSAGVPSNEYVRDGYEASFGLYDIDEATHTLTHHIQGSITGDLLVGKDLRRVYRFTADGTLIIRSSRPDEHWSVTGFLSPVAPSPANQLRMERRIPSAFNRDLCRSLLKRAHIVGT